MLVSGGSQPTRSMHTLEQCARRERFASAWSAEMKKVRIKTKNYDAERGAANVKFLALLSRNSIFWSPRLTSQNFSHGKSG